MPLAWGKVNIGGVFLEKRVSFRKNRTGRNLTARKIPDQEKF